METNKSLSARIKRRNAQCFYGVGTGHIVDSVGYVHSYTTVKAKNGGMGDYLDEKQNHKYKDRQENNIRRSKLGKPTIPDYKLDEKGNIVGFTPATKNRQYSKKYADKHQRL